MALLRIDEYTDPGCPWAWSAEPARRRIDWLYGDAVEWRLRLVGLSESAEEYEEKGLTPEKMARGMANISRDHGMPMATHERPRIAPTISACRAIAAAREHGGERLARALLRELRLAHFGGRLFDEPEVIDAAAAAAGIDAARLAQWLEDPAVEHALRADMAEARDPSRAALALEHKLASWSGGQRYTCPSYEMVRLDPEGPRADQITMTVPGFQPFTAYDVVLANLLPDVERRADPETTEEVLAWAGEPLASAEVAAVLGVTLEDAREQLGTVATETHLGFDGLWSLPRYSRPASAVSSERASGTAASAAASSSTR